ncbi:MAG: hypothetical protein MZV49_12735 [Rhodopseudomonas palustris]|nr:hypothetical protein [Rhodopseudomonas palustris]
MSWRSAEAGLAGRERHLPSDRSVCRHRAASVVGLRCGIRRAGGDPRACPWSRRTADSQELAGPRRWSW